jgi:hypothetical protein
VSAESYSYTGQRIADDVTQKFGDVGGVQITSDMILRWINDGQRDIIKDSPFNQQTAAADIVAGQANYPYSSFLNARILQFDSIVVNGTPCKVIPYQEFQQRMLVPGYQPATADMSMQQVFATTYGGNIILWPTPSASIAGGLVLNYIAYPADLTTLDTLLSVPDRFYNALQSYVFGQALMLDENWDAAKAVLGQSAQDKQRELERENRSPNDFYPTVTDTESVAYYQSPGLADYPLV